MDVCPYCSEQVSPEAMTCRKCGAPLLSEGERQAPNPDLELVPVFRTADQGRIVLAKSLLESEEIDYMVRGEGVHDLFAWGRALTGFNAVVGPVEFVVRMNDAARARDLLHDLTEAIEPPT